MTEYTGGQRQQIHKQERRKRRRFRQQQVENGGGSRDIEGGDHQLQKGQTPTRQAQGAPPGTNQQIVGVGLFRQTTAIDADRQHCTEDQYGSGDRAQQEFGQPKRLRGGGQVAQGGQRCQWRQGAAQREAGK